VYKNKTGGYYFTRVFHRLAGCVEESKEHFGEDSQWRTEGGGFKPPEIPKFYKGEPNSQFRGKYVHS
jgi:hypothetical protein